MFLITHRPTSIKGAAKVQPPLCDNAQHCADCFSFQLSVFAEPLPDPPQVTVDLALLDLFGITEDVNEKGLFQKLIQIPRGINSTYPHIRQLAMMAKEELHEVHKNMLNMSAINFSRTIIDIYRNLPEQRMVQFIAAHTINMYIRFDNILTKIKDDILHSFGRLYSYDNESQKIRRCNRIAVVSVAAKHYTHEIDTEPACQKFLGMAKQNETIILSLIETVNKSKMVYTVSLHFLVDERVPLSMISQHFRRFPPLPLFYHSYLYGQLLEGFRDYSNFYSAVEYNKELAHVLGMPPSRLKDIFARHFTQFLRKVDLV